MEDLKITEASFRRVFNFGNYETIAVELRATVTEKQDVQDVLKALDKATIRFRKSWEA